MQQYECNKCQESEPEVQLRKCPICFKHYCDDHSVQKSGVWFCSVGCGEYFFYAEPDE